MPSDIRLSTDFFSSRKTKRLRRRNGADYVLALQQVWILTARSYPNGTLKGLDADDIADEIDWPHDPDELMSALTEHGFIDVDDSGTYSVHDWGEWQPWVSAAPARQRASRKAIHERWANKGACKGGSEFCDERCPSVKDDTETKSNENSDIYEPYTERIRDEQIRNSPLPSPIPLPSPSPLPAPDEAAPVTSQDECPTADGVGLAGEVESTETAPEAHSEPPPIAEPDPIAKTPQAPTEPATDTGPFSAVSGLIDNLRAGLDAMGDNRPPGEMNPNDVMTKGQVQNAMIRGGRMHIVSDVATQRGLIELTRMQPTAGELQRVMELYENVGPGYLAKVIGTERQGGSRKRQFSPPAQAQQPTAITVPRKVEAIHESHERCKRAHLAMQLECGLSPNEAEAERMAARGMPTDDDRERYLSANKDWNNLAERERSAMNACLASVYAH